MEDEAFGPPSRPGEPDFPESEEASVQAGNGAAAEAEAPAFSEEPEAAESAVIEDRPVEEEPAFEDLDLELEEEPAAEPETQLQQPPPEAAEPEQTPQEAEASEDVPIESVDTVEHPFPDEVTEPESLEHEGEPADEEPVSPEEDRSRDEAPAEEEGEGDDVLADTPEFLKDAPEDDELWFEQGEPKDFDF